jgi:hypothetical protein
MRRAEGGKRARRSSWWRKSAGVRFLRKTWCRHHLGLTRPRSADRRIPSLAPNQHAISLSLNDLLTQARPTLATLTTCTHRFRNPKTQRLQNSLSHIECKVVCLGGLENSRDPNFIGTREISVAVVFECGGVSVVKLGLSRV